jgi:hypothetical protein
MFFREEIARIFPKPRSVDEVGIQDKFGISGGQETRS